MWDHLKYLPPETAQGNLKSQNKWVQLDKDTTNTVWSWWWLSWWGRLKNTEFDLIFATPRKKNLYLIWRLTSNKSDSSYTSCLSFPPANSAFDFFLSLILTHSCQRYLVILGKCIMCLKQNKKMNEKCSFELSLLFCCVLNKREVRWEIRKQLL